MLLKVSEAELRALLERRTQRDLWELARSHPARQLPVAPTTKAEMIDLLVQYERQRSALTLLLVHKSEG